MTSTTTTTTTARSTILIQRWSGRLMISCAAYLALFGAPLPAAAFFTLGYVWTRRAR